MKKASKSSALRMPNPLVRLRPASRRGDSATTGVSETQWAESVAALQRGESRWRTALECTGDGVWDWDMKSNKVYFSGLWKSMLGYDEAEVADTYEEWSTRVHPDDLKDALRDIKNHAEGRTSSYANEHRLRCKNGTWKWILARGRILERDATGAPLRMIGTHVDISRRKEAEARATLSLALAAEGAPFPAVLDTIARGIEAKHPGVQCCVLQVNRADRRLDVVTAPSLPDYFRIAIDRRPLALLKHRGKREVITHLDSSPAWAAGRAAALQAGIVACWSEPILGEDGEVMGVFSCFLRSNRKPSTEEVTSVESAVALAAIILSRARTEADRETNAAQLRAINDNAPDMIFYVGLEPPSTFRILQANRSFLKAKGMSEASVVGRRVEHVIPKESLERVLQYYKTAVRTKRTVRWEDASTYPGGRLHERVSITPVLDERGNVTHLVGIGHDITQRKLAEAALEASNTKLNLVLKTAPIVLWHQDRNLRYTWVFSAREELDQQAMIGKTDAEIWPPDSANQLTKLKRRVLRSQRSERKQLQLELPGGKFVSYDVSVIPLRGDDGAVAGIVGVALDNTALVTAGRALKLSEEQLARIAVEREEEKRYFQDLALELKATQRERLRLASDLHDGILQFLAASDYQLQAVEGFESDPEKVANQVRIVRQLLRKMKVELRNSLWGLNAVGNCGSGFVELLRHSLGSMLHWPSDAVIFTVHGTPRDLSPRVAGSLLLIVREAVANAFKHGEAVRVVVSVSFGGKSLQISIKDDGMGFKARKAEGTAEGHYGLAGMRRRVRWLGGSLRIVSAPKKGTQVYLVLPWRQLNGDTGDERKVHGKIIRTSSGRG
jgi:PAS domain S-box-containing protein